MMRWLIRSGLGLALLLALLWPLATSAQQTKREVVVLHTAVTDQGVDNGMLVRSYFSLRDASGEPILKSDLKLKNEGSIEFLGGGRAARAVIAEPDAPIKIVLLLDASGSMRPNIEVAKAAALKALDSAPERAQIFVYQFTVLDVNTAIGTPERFSSNRDLWRSEVNAWKSVSGAGTCLYNATFQAVQLLAEAAQPEERRAVILFTDGVDEQSGGGRCSERGAENAIISAKEHHVPIYTIGLCASQSCSSIDESVLARMARETDGAKVVGVVDQIEARFQRIMDILDSQWMAKATLYPRKGPNTAALSVSADGDSQPILGTFTLESQFDYYAPPSFQPTVTYEEATDRYLLNLNAANLNALGGVTLTINDKGAGTQQDKLTIAPDSMQNALPITAEKFLAGHEYCFQVRATNREGTPFQLGPEEVERGADPTVLASQCVKYAPVLKVSIESVTPQWDTKKLLIQLSMSGVGQRQVLFDGTIVSKAGNKIADIRRTAPEAGELIQIDLPAALRQAGEKDEFTVQLRTEAGGQQLEASRTFSIVPQSGPNWLLPIGLGVLLLAMLGVGGWLFYRRWQARPSALPAPLQYSELTTRIDQPGPPPPVRTSTTGQRPVTVHIRVLKTPDPTQKKEVIVTSFPFLIGRGEKDTQLSILNDNGISRQHIQIHQSGQEITVTDLKSVNGTFIDERPLKPQESVTIRGHATVRLGPHTIIEITLK
jgi:hypothetical protein